MRNEYLTLFNINDKEFKVTMQNALGNDVEFVVQATDSINSILIKADSALTKTELELAATKSRLDLAESKIEQTNQKITELDSANKTLTNEISMAKSTLKQTEEKFGSILEGLMSKADWSKLDFIQFTDACGKLKLLSIGAGIIFNNHKYIVKKDHMPDPDETPDKRGDLYFPLDTAVKEALVELVQGRKYEKGTIGSFRGTVYRCEVANNNAPIGTPGYWTNLGPVANYK